MRCPALVLVPLVLLALAAPVASAAAPPRTVRLVSLGTANTTAVANLISGDGSRIVFATTEALVPQDTNGVSDAYARDKNGGLQLIGTGAGTGSAAVAISADGDRVVYSTTNADLPVDTDGAADLYERRRNGSLRLISTSGAATAVGFVDASATGADVLFSTTENIPGTGDGDAVTDWYDRRADGSLRLVTPGTTVAMSSGFGGHSISDDGAVASFATTESLLPADGDAVSDGYSAPTAGGPYTLLTPGTTDGVTALMNRAATRWWFSSTSSLIAGDTDTAVDVYERRGDGSIHLVSGGSANTAASLTSARDDGSSVVFSTTEKLLPADGDATGFDLYERRADGSLHLVSGGTTVDSASFAGTNHDGSVLFFTVEPLVAADADATVDMYIRRPNGTLQLGTPGTPTLSGSILIPPPVNDRSRATMTSSTDVPGTGDSNGQPDVYEVTDDGFRPLTLGVPGGTFQTLLESADGSRIIFTTTSTIPGTGDSDTASDVYEADFAVPVISGVPTMSGAGRVGHTETCSTLTATGEGLTNTFGWFRDAVTILGATGKTYKPVLADAGHRLRCRFISANGVGTDTADSASRKLPPAARSPKLGGFPIVGTKLSCTSFAGATRTTYKWKRGSKTVRGRTTRAYKVARADLGKRVSCSAVAKNGTLSTSVSQRVTVPRQCKVPNVRGLTPGDAKTRLGNAGCRSTTKRISGSGVPVGRVLGTSPGKGKKRANGARITINVRK